ncbi:unnamed protein product [Cunninghamella echinulata]
MEYSFNSYLIDVNYIPNFPVSKEEFSGAVECDEITLIYRNIKDVCEILFESKPVWPFMKMGSEITTFNNEKVYNGTFTSKYWYGKHMEINKNHPGVILSMLILSLYQTIVSAWISAARLCIFQYAMSLIFSPFIKSKLGAYEMKGPFGKIYQCYPTLFSYSADFPEQCTLACTGGVKLEYGCPRCFISTINFKYFFSREQLKQHKKTIINMKNILEVSKKVTEIMNI